MYDIDSCVGAFAPRPDEDDDRTDEEYLASVLCDMNTSYCVPVR